MKKLSIRVLQEYAKAKNGLLVSTEYKNKRTNLTWQCEQKHQWEATYGNVKNNGSWCPVCSKRVTETLFVLQQYAKKLNGKCLSTTYLNVKQLIEWQCQSGHQWKCSWNSIKNQGMWCPRCGGKATVEDLQQHALNKGGKLLSIEYTNSMGPLLWQCKMGHKWNACWNSIKNNNSWCLVCNGTAKSDIEELKQFARSNSGKLLSNEYKNNKAHLLWACEKGHTWEACWYSVNICKSWCPRCATFKTEALCRQLLEEKLKISFPKQRIYYDTTNKQTWLEFDGYNEEHKTAFEYNGKQHYEYPNFYHKSEQEFLSAQDKDKRKRQYAIDNDIKLIIIPHTKKHVLNTYIEEAISVL